MECTIIKLCNFFIISSVVLQILNKCLHLIYTELSKGSVWLLSQIKFKLYITTSLLFIHHIYRFSNSYIK